MQEDTNTMAEFELEELQETFTEEQQKLIDEARAVEADKPERAPEAWRKVVQAAPDAVTPRLELARVQKNLERWNGVVDALNDALRRLGEEYPGRKRALLFELIDIYANRMKLDVKVLECYKKLIEIDPTDLKILDAAADHFEKARRYTDLVNTLRQRAEVAGDPAEKVATYLRIARLFLERNNHAEAVKAYEAVLEQDATNEEALSALKEMYERRRDWEKLVRVYEREIDQAEDDEAKREGRLKVARLASEKLRKPDLAIDLWEKVLAVDADNVEALEHLEQLYKRQKEWEKLADVLSRRGELVEDPSAQPSIWLELGILYTDRVEDHEKAVEAWKRLLAVDPKNRRAQDALKKLYLAQKDWQALEEFYGGLGAWEELVRVFDRQAGDEEPETQVLLLSKVASLWLEKIGRPERAVGAFEKILHIDPDNLEAAEALIPIFSEANNFKKLVGVLEIQARHTEDPDERLERLRRIAEIYEKNLRDASSAMTTLLDSLESFWNQDWLREEIERLAQATGRWQDLVEAYDKVLDKFADPEDSLPLRRVIAKALEEHLAEFERAIEVNGAILELAENDWEALKALERLYQATEQWEKLLDVLQRLLSVAGEADERRRVLFAMARLSEAELEDDDKAVEYYAAALDLGEDPEALEALDRLYTTQEKWEELADILRRRLALIPEDEVDSICTLKYRLAQVLENELGQADQALAEYRDILEINPGHEQARSSLEAKLAHPELKFEAARVLEPIYETLAEWERLVQVYEILAEGAGDTADKVEMLLKAGQLRAQNLGETDQAFETYATAFRVDPDRTEAVDALEQLCEIEEKWGELAALYEEVLGGDLDPSLKKRLYSSLAEIYDQRLENADKAVEAYKQALSIDEQDASGLDALEKLYTRREQWPELLDVYRKKVELSVDPEERQRMLFQIAYLQEEMLGRPTEAVETYREILGDSPDNLDALRALDRLYVAQEDWRELADNLVRQLELVGEDREQQIQLLNRLAALRLEHLDEVAAAVETYRRIIELDEENEQAIAALESLLSDDSHRLAAAEILEPIYRMRDDWTNSVRVYEVMVANTYDPARKLELLYQIGELYEIGGDDAQAAFEAYGRALAEEPSRVETRERLERLCREIGNWQQLVDLYKKLAADSVDTSLSVTLWMRVGELLDTQVGDQEEAAAAYNKVLEIDSQYIEAIEALEGLFVRMDDSARLVSVLLRKADVVTDPEDRKHLCFRAAAIQEEVLEDMEGAIATYRKVLEIDDAETRAIDALEGLFVRMERWEDLKDVYLKKAELAASDEDRKEMYYVLGQVYDAELDDKERAIETYRSVLEIDPEDLQAIQALDRLYFETENWYELLSTLEREVDLAEGSAEVTGLKHRIGGLWEKQLADMARAVETYREVLELDPTHEPTLEALERIAHGDEEPVAAAQVLEPVYRDSMEWEKLASVYEVLIAHADDPVSKVELLHQAAALYEQQLENLQSAFDAYSRAFAEDPTNQQTVAQVERLAGDIGGWESLAELYEGQLDKILDSTIQVEILLRLARVYEEELKKPDEAVARYQRALEHDPDCRPAVLALDRLFALLERWEDLAGVLRREIGMADSDEELVEIQFRLGQLYEQNIKDMDNAVESYREILEIDPEHSPTLSALELLFTEGIKRQEIGQILEPLYVQAGQWERLVRILEAQLEQVEDLMDRLSAIQRIADIYENQLFDQVEAFRWWGRAYLEDVTSEMAVEELDRLAEQTESWDELIDIYDKAAEQTEDKSLLKSVLLKKARVCEEKTQDQAQWEEALLKVLEVDGDEPDALAGLDRLYSRAQMFEELADVLARRVKVSDDPTEVVELLFRLAEVQEHFLENFDAAVAAYKQILDEDMRNIRALEGLEKIYFAREEWKELYGIYEQLLDVAASDSEMADCYARMAKIASHALEDPEDAKQKWHQVLDLQGDDFRAYQALADLYEDAGEWQDLVDILQRFVDALDDDERRVEVYHRIARVQRDNLAQDLDAIDSFHRILEIDPNNVEALYGLVGLYRQTQAWEELAETLYRLVDIGTTLGDLSDDALLALYSQIGELQGQVLMRPDEAIEAWQRVLDIDPTNFKALGELETLFTQEARWPECIQVLERKVNALEDPVDKVDTLLQMASIWESKEMNPAHAAAAYERVLELDPSHQMASENLERIYRENAEWQGLVSVLERRFGYVEETADQVAVLHEIARIIEQNYAVPDLDQAFAYLLMAFELDYMNETTASELERLATEANKWNELLMKYNEKVAELSDIAIKCNLLVKIGRWYATKLSRPDYAIASLQQALQLDSNNRDALAGLADFYRSQGHWGELVQTLTRLSDLETDPLELSKIFLQLGGLYEDKLISLMDPNQAIQLAVQAYQKALDADEESEEALVALERLYRTYQNWEPLVDILRRRVDLTAETDRVIEIKEAIGELYEDRLDNAYKAIEAYKDILTVDPQNMSALKALERLYEKTGQMEEYLDVLEQELDYVGTDDERVSKYRQMAAVWEEHFDKVDRAAECYEKILLIDDVDDRAYANLERLYRQDGKWEDLVDTYAKHINAVSSPSDRIELYRLMGDVYERQLNDVDQSIDAYRAILDYDPDHVEALSALSRLYEQVSDWDGALDALQRLAQLIDDPRVQVETYHRIGHILEDAMADTDGAEVQYTKALEVDPAYVPSMTALTAIYQGRSEWLKAAKMMLAAEEHTNNILERTKLLYEAGRIYLDHLEDREMAAELLARVLELDPEHVEAAEPLAELYFEQERWEELEPIMDMLSRKAEGKDNRTLAGIYYRAAHTAHRLGKLDKALKYYQMAYDLDSTHLPTLKGMAEILYAQEQWDRSFKIYQTILVHHRDSQSTGEITDVFYRLGNIKLQLGETKKALNMYEKALEVDPGHRDTLLAVIDLQSNRGDWEAVIHAKRSFLRNDLSDEERFQILEDIGDIYDEKMNNAQKAIAAYQEALELDPSHHRVLQKTLEKYYDTKQWKKAIEVIDKFIEMESSPQIRAKYSYTAAAIYRDELKALDEALQYFNQTLDDNWEHLKAFQAIDKICTQKKDWKALERNYRKMIKRVPADSNAPLVTMLWHNLGEIYRTRMQNYEAAIAAFDVAATLEPNNMQRHQILAELYELLGGEEALTKAIGEYQWILKADPGNVDVYKKLFSVYRDTRQYDKAWCVASALAFHRRADPQEMRLFEEYRQKGLVRARQRMGEDLWTKYIFHPDENRIISSIFAIIAPAVAAATGRPLKQYGLKRKEARNLVTDQLMFTRLFNYTLQALNLQERQVAPDLYLRPDQPGGLMSACALEKGQLIPFCIAGASLLQGRSDKELAFAIAKELSYFRPEHFILRVVTQITPGQLKLLLLAALRLITPNVNLPGVDPNLLEQQARLLQKHIPQSQVGLLTSLAKHLMTDLGAVDLGKWLNAVELTANRVGFVVSNDLPVAANMLRLMDRAAVPVGGMTLEQKIADLVTYSISEEYFEVRKQLGLTIGQ